MENLDEQLKTNIRSILCSISDDTINGIIQALKYAGLETMSDLEFAQEEDLILVLKPFPRRKLIKAWSEQNKNFSSPQEPNVLSLQYAFLEKTKNTFEANENPGIPPPKGPNALSPEYPFLEETKETSKANKNSGVSSPKEPAVFSQKYVFLENTKNTFPFETNEHPGISPPKEPNALPSQYTFMKETKDDSETDEDSDLSSAEESNTLPLQHSFVEEPKRASLSCENTGFVLPRMPVAYFRFYDNQKPNPLPEKPNPLRTKTFKWRRKKWITLLQVFAKYKTEFLTPDVKNWEVWETIANEVGKKYSSNCDVWSCYSKMDELQHKYEKIKIKNTITAREYAFMELAKYAFETDENSVILADYALSNVTVRWTWTKPRSRHLLQVYTKSKTELSCPEVQEQEVWKKIALKVKELCCITCNEVDCRNRINEMKLEYEAFKNGTRNVKTQKDALFMREGKIAFENSGDPVEKSSSPLLPEFHRKLLQVYTQYKNEFSHSDIGTEEVWEKIVNELRDKFHYHCTESSCRFELSELQSRYESLKKEEGKSETMSDFFEEAQKAFETTQNHGKLKISNF